MFGQAYGARRLLAWVCGEESTGPLSGLRTTGRPTLYQISLDVRRAMTALDHARNDNQPTMVGRMEATMETFLWLTGWDGQLSIDRHSHLVSESGSGVYASLVMKSRLVARHLVRVPRQPVIELPAALVDAGSIWI